MALSVKSNWHPFVSRPFPAALLFLALALALSTPFAEAGKNSRKSRTSATPSISISSAPSQVSEGGSATYTITSSRAVVGSPLAVGYSMSGTAVSGTHYTLSGSVGQAIIAVGASSTTVKLTSKLTALSTGSEVATMNVRSGTGYKLASNTVKSSVTIFNVAASPTPTPTPTPTPKPTATPTPKPTATPTPTPTATPRPTATPTATPSPTPSATPSATPTATPQATPLPTEIPSQSPRPTPSREVWISVRTDGVTGTGTQADPYDGSSQEKFDNVMGSLQSSTNLLIHLGPGTFRTAIAKNGSPYGPPGFDTAAHPWAVQSGWAIEGAGMDATAIQMAGPAPTLVANTVVLSGLCTVPTNDVIIRDLTVDGNWSEINSTALSGVGGEKNLSVSGIAIAGSNNLIERVRCINVYGAYQSQRECVSIRLFAPPAEDGVGNVIHDCRSEQPYGNYSSAFCFSGSDNLTHYLVNSKIYGCTGVGINSGTIAGFTVGGVNGGGMRNCEVSGNTFIDCPGAFYSDTGSIDGLKILNNTVVRGWKGVNLVASSDVGWTKKNIEVRGNNISVQNRAGGAPSDAITFQGSATTGITIDANTISFDTTAPGLTQYHTILGHQAADVTISNNVIASALPYLTTVQFYSCSNVVSYGNRDTQGGAVPGLN